MRPLRNVLTAALVASIVLFVLGTRAEAGQVVVRITSGGHFGGHIGVGRSVHFNRGLIGHRRGFAGRRFGVRPRFGVRHHGLLRFGRRRALRPGFRFHRGFGFRRGFGSFRRPRFRRHFGRRHFGPGRGLRHRRSEHRRHRRHRR